MENTITSVITSFDLQGKYMDMSALQQLKHDFQIDEPRVCAAALIRDHAAAIVKEAVAKSLSHTEENGIHTTRRYAACVRDLDFYLRYSTYAMVAGDTALLDERVLNGLKETYLALGVPLTATVNAIQAMKDVTTELVGIDAGREISIYFDHLCAGLS
ncbi:allophycocyanin subunit beta [Acaryochloris sp. IP29b_bin.148]|uniref:allophycocyanin subunit beta n=1 Tax=Acaryochloris sp. IP29b_bin.148 TaxID=2969218 RepID=UPI0026346644|nr:allophycocyanin subunit beta [Acaryochloris sp. IP29b_bin.148]